MYQFGFERSALIIFLVFNIFAISTSGLQDYRKYGDQMMRQTRGEDDYHGNMWFGPRLGKRSSRLAEDDRQAWSRVMEAAEALKFYYSQLPEDPEISLQKKIHFTPKLGRSATNEMSLDGVNFTPRLGRQVVGEFSRVTPADRENFRSDGDQAEVRPPLFSPRLGRNTLHYSPRLGRELLYELTMPEEETVRTVRSVTEKKKPMTAARST